MGITGLLPQLKNIQNPVSLNRYSGQTLGIDGYAWLHRGTFSCANDLVLGNPTDKYLQFFIKKFAMLKSYNIEPYLVFDGNSLPVKKNTEKKRSKKRIENKETALKLWNSGEKKNAMDYFQKSVDVTPEMAKCVIDYCKLHGIKYVVAPYEADSQLVYLEKMNLVQGIISEDSDLLIFGCNRLLTKLNDFGECIEICRNDFNQVPKKFPISELSDAQLRCMVCLSGCDYTDGIPRIGLMKAIKLVKQYQKMDKILLSIQRENKLTVPKTFLREYHQADLAFRFQRVYCPIKKKLVSLNNLNKEIIDEISLNYDPTDMFIAIGLSINKNTNQWACVLEEADIHHELHTKIARGDLSPYDFNKLLVNREHRLQLYSKSDLTNASKPISKSVGIENYFSKMKKTSNETSISFNTIQVKRPVVDKMELCVKRRKLTSNLQIPNIASVTLSKSKFFSQNNSTKSVIGLSQSKESSSENYHDSLETEIPDSELPTQIPSSYPLIENLQSRNTDLPLISQIKTESGDNLFSHTDISDRDDNSITLSEIDDNNYKNNGILANCDNLDSSILVESDDSYTNDNVTENRKAISNDIIPNQNNSVLNKRPSTSRTVLSSSSPIIISSNSTLTTSNGFLQQFKYSSSQPAARSSSLNSTRTNSAISTFKTSRLESKVFKYQLGSKENIPDIQNSMTEKCNVKMNRNISRTPLAITDPNKLSVSRTNSLKDFKLTQTTRHSKEAGNFTSNIANGMHRPSNRVVYATSPSIINEKSNDMRPNLEKTTNFNPLSSLSKFIYKDSR